MHVSLTDCLYYFKANNKTHQKYLSFKNCFICAVKSKLSSIDMKC